MSPSQLVKEGLCDPVRLFVKQEPHTLKKLAERRYRLISSVSLPDQLIERMLFGPQNELEISSWDRIPSKPGMGLSLDSQAQSLWRDLCFKHLSHPAAEADISGFDWSVQDWELWADLSMRIDLCLDMHEGLKRLYIARFYCFMNSVFQFSNGELYEQKLPGLMKSGSYCTSSTNSRIRCLMGYLIGSPWIIAMGDDSVEGWLPDAKERYHVLGHTCKEYSACPVDRDGDLKVVNFCSHELSLNSYYLTSWARTLYRFLSDPRESVNELRMELESCPAWPKIEAYISQVRNVPDKTNKESNHAPKEENSFHGTARDGVGQPYAEGPLSGVSEIPSAQALSYYGPNGSDSECPRFDGGYYQASPSSDGGTQFHHYRPHGSGHFGATGSSGFLSYGSRAYPSQLDLGEPDSCGIL